MTKVTKTANTLDEGVKNMIDSAKEDYKFWSSKSKDGISTYSQNQLDNWDNLIKISKGKKYIKVVRENCVFAFIVKEDFKHFRKGDILKPAGFQAPALNQPRGNVLSGNYEIRWTGPMYLK
jgi:hypothetical protein